MSFCPVAKIDLDAVCSNYGMLAALVPGTAVAPVVKCDGYGLGAGVIARELAERNGARTFFVTYPFEGARLRSALREAAPHAEIFVFDGPDPASFSQFRLHDLTPVLNSLDQARLWSDAAQGAPAALHIDTGMNRLGAPLSDLSAIAALNIDLSLVLSHLACSSEPSHPMNRMQLDALRNAAARFPGVPLSIAASGGALADSQFHLDLIRPGAALYGVSPFDVADARLAPVVTLTAPVLQLRIVKKGDTAGYGRSWTAPAPSRLAAVALGYGDGYPRNASNRGAAAFVGGSLCEIVGRVSMDLIILDVTNAPEPVEIGSIAEFFGDQIPIEDAAARCGTIGYELLTGLGPRVKRRYLRGGHEVDSLGSDPG